MRINEPSPPHSPNKRQVSQAMLSLQTTGRNSVSARLRNESSDLRFENQRTPPPLDCNSVSAGSRQIIPSSRMFIHSDLYLADTNQSVAYSGPGKTKDVDRIANCNWWPKQEKQFVLMFVHRWRGGAKWLTSQGGFGRTPRTPPGSAPV